MGVLTIIGCHKRVVQRVLYTRVPVAKRQVFDVVGQVKLQTEAMDVNISTGAGIAQSVTAWCNVPAN